jgi:hypothetical protein
MLEGVSCQVYVSCLLLLGFVLYCILQAVNASLGLSTYIGQFSEYHQGRL